MTERTTPPWLSSQPLRTPFLLQTSSPHLPLSPSFWPISFLKDSDRESQATTASTNESLLNDTRLPDDMTFNDTNLMSVIVLSVLCFVASIGNLTVFWTLWRQRRCGSRVNLFIMNLSAADLIVALIMMPLEIAWHLTVRWLADDITCRVMMFFRAFGLYLSSNILVVLSLDRCLTVRKPVSPPASNRRSRLMIVLAWLVSVIYSLPQSVIFHVESHPEHRWFSQCVTFNFFPNDDEEMAYNIFNLLAVYLLPLVVIIVCYSLILLQISRTANRTASRESDGFDRQDVVEANDDLEGTGIKFNYTNRGKLGLRRSKQTSSTSSTFTPQQVRLKVSSSGGQKRSTNTTIPGSKIFIMNPTSAGVIQKAKSRTLRMTIVIVSAFIVCWTPYFVMSTWYWFHEIHPTLQKVLFLFAMSNSCVDPIVYGMFSTAFRKSVTICCLRIKKNFVVVAPPNRPSFR